MIRHGTKAKEGEKVPRKRTTPRVIRDQTFVVVSCPDELYTRGAEFKSTEVYLGLRHDGHECVWPEGMTFRRGGRVFVIRGGILLDDRGAPYTGGKLHGRKAGQ